MDVRAASAFPVVPEVRKVILDTNIVLDLFVFDDAATLPLQQALEAQQLRWLATQDMRVELERVLAYKQIVPRLAYYQRTAAEVLAQFDRHVELVAVASKAPLSCRDADDQKFIDLAVVHPGLLLSKDRAVLCLKKRLLPFGVQVLTVLEAAA